MEKIRIMAEKNEAELIRHRRWLHQHAELAWKEVETTRYITNELKKLGLEPCYIDGCTGCYAYIHGGQAKEGAATILLRADIDAMEGQDLKEVPYASIYDGAVHMCGHDANTAMLLGAAKILAELQDELKGNVKLVFQPAEEFAYGAKVYVEQGIVDDVQAAFAEHVWSETPAGQISAEPGRRFAGGSTFKITVHGKANHTGAPHLANDAILAAAQIVENLQMLETRMKNPLDTLVVAVGTIKGGDVPNAYAKSVELTGTVRTHSRELQKEISGKLEELVETTARLTGCTAEIERTPDMPPIVHDSDKFTKMVRGSAEKLYGKSVLYPCAPTLGSDDFAYFLEKVPGLYCMIGTYNIEKGYTVDPHDPSFDIDESILKIGTAMYAQVAYDFINSQSHPE